MHNPTIPSSKVKSVRLSEIVTTAGTQIRARIDTETVNQYAEAMHDATTKFPPVVLFHDGSQYILADGFHRVMAAHQGFLDILAEVHKGTRADALRYALSANATHGLRRTNTDKRRSVELALSEWPKLSNREIARLCAVSDPFVADVRQLLTVSSSEPQTRVGADGRERKLPTRAEPDERPHVIAHAEVMPTPASDDRHEGELTAADCAMIRKSFRAWFAQWPKGDASAVVGLVRDELRQYGEGSAS